MDDLRIDSHKLLFHPQAVTKWERGEDIYPISLEVSLSNACNHRCVFCTFDYLGYTPTWLDKDIILTNLKLLSERGLKSVVFAGEGEPLLHKDAKEIIQKTKQFGLDVGISTNGVLFNSDFADACLEDFTWIRFSFNGGTPESYSEIHSTKKEDFNTVLKNIENAVNIKKKNNLKTTLGVQFLLIPENMNEVINLAKILKRIDVDYFTVKPYSQHPGSINKRGHLDYSNFGCVEEDLNKLQTDQYKIYFRAHSMKKLSSQIDYDVCFGTEFVTHIDSFGNIVPCVMYVGNNEFKYGNLYEENILQIWDKRRVVLDKINSIGTKNCKKICRLDEINKYLFQLKNPGSHVNFI